MDGRLVGSEIHGFYTLQDLDVGNIMEEARTRWFRPNEIHAILCNYKYFTINAKPVNLPRSGTIVLFDRKMLRNFRKDGHNWKKKNDGKTVKEAHEHLKVGSEERIHVYYAHGLDNPTFVRRCYWLLDKRLEHIVLVHYRETQELQGFPSTPNNSHSSSVSEITAPQALSEELDSRYNQAYYTEEPIDGFTNHELKLHEINTLDWDELLVTSDSNNTSGQTEDKISSFEKRKQFTANRSIDSVSAYPSNSLPGVSSSGSMTQQIAENEILNFNIPENFYIPTRGSQVNSNTPKEDSGPAGIGDSLDILVSNGLQSQDSFGRWVNNIMADSPALVENAVPKPASLSGQDSYTTPAININQLSTPKQIFSITDLSPAWGFSTEKTKILITGFFLEDLGKSNIFCVCGDVCIPAEIVQVGVYRCLVSTHSPGLVNLFMSLDGREPISQVLNFEFRTPHQHELVISSEDNSKWEVFRIQTRLACLLYSTSKSLNILSNKVSPHALKEAKKFLMKTSHISSSWAYLINSIEDNITSFPQAKDRLFELSLRSRLKEWLLERIIEGRKTTEYDAQGLGVIHLCSILGYTGAVQLFSLSGLSLDYRDKHGWTALHWAAYCGREKMVAVLLSAGSKANLVTDPTPENPGGCTAADLASAKGYDGLAAYLAERGLVDHFNAMSLAGNVCGTLQTSTDDTGNPENFAEEDLYLKDTLAAYRTAADAAARIQTAIREHALKLRTKAVQFSSPEAEARNIVAAMKIQHAFRNFETRKRFLAAGRIQHRFRTWKIRREYLNMRRQAIRIQAAFRGFQVRRQYRKILWSVGVLEKAILRWRLKRKGFRGLQIDPVAGAAEHREESDAEEEFFSSGRKQAEERVERSVVKVQAMFRSKKAQEDYRRMKLTHNQAKMEYQEFLYPDTEMDR